MTTVTQILNSLRGTSSKNEKERIIRENADNTGLREAFRIAYSKELNFFVRGFKPPYCRGGALSLGYSIDLLVEHIAGRVYTGDEARRYMETLVSNCEEPETLLAIINRDLECGVQSTITNKVWKDLITEPPYQSYTLFKPELLKKFNYKGAFSDEKMDGLYADIMVWPEQVIYRSRSGKELGFRLLNDIENRLMAAAQKQGAFVAHGEGLVIDSRGLHGVMERAEGNGYLNQDPEDIDSNLVRVVIWDMVTMDEYINRKTNVPYTHRRDLADILVEEIDRGFHFQMVKGRKINTMKEAIDHFIEMRKQKKEGTVLKEAKMPWGDNKTKKGVKLKNEFDVDLLVIGTLPHKKDPSLVGSLVCQTRDGLLEVGVGSGLTDALRKKGPEFFIGKIVTVKANDITNSDTKDLQSLFLPRLFDKFVEIRYDKSTANSLEEVVEHSDSLLALLQKIAEEVENGS